ncbi:MAG: hypothetical protein EBW52_12285, partial [Betaproteobacteria bacterium]|nr:hypothetical protein [Betaproteobacteria bacterium]
YPLACLEVNHDQPCRVRRGTHFEHAQQRFSLAQVAGRAWSALLRHFDRTRFACARRELGRAGGRPPGRACDQPATRNAACAQAARCHRASRGKAYPD